VAAWSAPRVSLRTKITAAFTIVVVGGTAVSTVIGSRIIENALVEQARARNVHALSVARTLYAETLETVRTAVARAASAPPAPGGLPDFVRVVPPDLTPSDPCLADASVAALVGAAVAQASARVSTELLSRPCLDHLGFTGAADGSATGLVLLSAAPVSLRAARPAGAVAYGAVPLDGRHDLVDRVKQYAYGDATHDGRAIGAVSILAGERRIATTVANDAGARAVGEGPLPDGYIVAAEPLRNGGGLAVGALQAAMLQAPILVQRTNMMLTFLVVCGIGLAVVFAITYLITRRMISPLEQMAAAAKTIASGDLSVRVPVHSRDEVGDLATSFNDMLASLQEMKTELEEWGRTLEQRVKQRTEELVSAQQRMAQAEKLASVGRLAAGVAHSINNPLGGILSLSMLALEDVERDSRLREDLETISAQALRCREIVKGLLNFSRESDARLVRVDAVPLVDDALSLLERQGRFDGVTVVRDYAGGPSPVLIDPGRLQEAVSNLVENAIDAMDGRGTLTLSALVTEAADEVVIRVADTGPGIAPDVMPYLFEPFFTTKRVGKGTGLGLAIVHGIVTGAGGRVEVASSPGQTTFTIRLPLAAEANRYGA
jgi:two-component system NtrC family sensor kinase